MTYVSPIQTKVDLYLDLINQGVPQAQALQQVGSTLAELSASGLDLSTPADRAANILAADIQLDNYVSQVDAARAAGNPPPPAPPGYSLPGQTVTTDNFFTAQERAAAQADPLGLNYTPTAVNIPQADNRALLRPVGGTTPAELPVREPDNTKFLRSETGVNPAPVVTPVLDNRSFLTPGTNSTAPAVPVDPIVDTAGAGTLTQAELDSGVIARTFTANANYQQVQFNNAERSRIVQEYQSQGLSAAEAYQDPRYRALVADGNILRKQVEQGSIVQTASTYQNSTELRTEYPVVSPVQAPVAFVPESPTAPPFKIVQEPVNGRNIQTVPVTDATVPVESLIIPGEPTALELRNQLSRTQTGINFDNFVAGELKNEINDINRELADTTSPAKRQKLQQQRDRLQQELSETEIRRDQLIQEQTNLQLVVDQSVINVEATPVDQDSVGTLAVNPAQINSQPEPLPFDPDLDTIPIAPSALSTEFNGTFSPTFDPDSDSWGVWDNQQGKFVVTGLTESQANRDAQEFADEGFVATVSNVPVQNNTIVNGSFSSAFDPETQSYGVWDNNTGVFVNTGLNESQADQLAADYTNDGYTTPSPPINQSQAQAAIDQAQGEQQNATLQLARQQQSIREQRGQQNQGDWRVKLRLAPGATYLYKANDPGILWPLIETDGVIFPYTPRIDTSYRAVYDAIDLTHSNYRGYFYRNSYADFVQVQGTFTAQDTFEAEYLLAVITFFKSLTKMFYGQDSQRGSPPPLIYLTGLGEYQFSEHPCVVTQFNYNLPDNVDYIRARIANVNATNLLTRRNRSSVPSNPISSAIQRLASLGQGIKPGAMTSPPPPPTLGIDNPTYVPTKIDISLQLLPMQSRRQVSQQFSLKNFANGNLIKGGFW